MGKKGGDDMTEARRVRLLVRAIFFLQPVAYGAWLPRIPDVAGTLGLTPAGLALVLLGLPVGTVLTLPFAGRIVGAIGARRAMLAGFLIYALALSLPGLATSGPLLFAALVAAGAAISFLELGLNVGADAAEKASGALVMNSAHGFWSLGIMAGSVLGSLLAGLGLSPGFAVPLAALVSVPLGLVAAARLPADTAAATPQTPTADEAPGGFTPPSLALWGICAFVFGVTMTEGAMADWSALFLRQVFAVTGAEAGLGYSLFALMVAVGRFAGDALKLRFGAVVLARTAVGIGLVGIVLVALSSAPVLALFGFALVGLGVSVGFPLAVSAVAALPGVPARNVAALTIAALSGFLVGPLVIGFIAEDAGLRLGLAALGVFLVASLILAGRLSAQKT
jgi:MFS family permease